MQRQQMAKALQESEAHYRALVEGSIQGIYIHCDGIVLFANQPLARLFGYNSPDALAGQELWQLVAPHERVCLEGYHRAHVQGDAAPLRYDMNGRAGVRTVKKYVQRLFDTLSVCDRTQAVAAAIRRGLIE